MRREPLEARKGALRSVLRIKAGAGGIRFNEFCDDLPADVVFRHACKLGFEGIVSKRLGSPYRSGRSRDWLKMKNPSAPAVKREAEEDWGSEKWRKKRRVPPIGHREGRLWWQSLSHGMASLACRTRIPAALPRQDQSAQRIGQLSRR